MTFSNALTPQASLAQSNTSQPQAAPVLACNLLWRQDKIVVTLADNTTDFVLPALADDAWFRTCLVKSKAKAVCIDSDLGQDAIQAWARACHEAKKPIYLRVPSMADLPQKQRSIAWWAKRLCDFVAALLLLIAFSPLMALLAGLVYLQDRGPILYTQWRVGHRGKLFRICKFRSMGVDAEQLHHQIMGQQAGLHKLKQDPRVTPLGRLMRKYSLDELPQLLNVLLGEMSLVGPRPWALYDALEITPNLRHRLNALPGMTGAWQVTARSHDCDLTSVNLMDLDYLRRWSVRNDFKFLLMTVPKVIAGFGAY
jgi:lipopolysaccharide/colanic/teichoic acid biosynthesis glycosyltransferase